jgi:hypothetical protein
MRQHRGSLLGEFNKKDVLWFNFTLTALKDIKQTTQQRRNEACHYPKGAINPLEEFYIAAESGQNLGFVMGWLWVRGGLRK